MLVTSNATTSPSDLPAHNTDRCHAMQQYNECIQVHDSTLHRTHDNFSTTINLNPDFERGVSRVLELYRCTRHTAVTRESSVYIAYTSIGKTLEGA